MSFAMAGWNDLIINPTFMSGLDQGWQPLCCSLSVDKTPQCGGPPTGHQFYCNAYNRTEAWQGIAQDITDRLKVNSLTHTFGRIELVSPLHDEVMV